eukprot:CAMPEP_0173381746 /NCGR_PEP_ID=MMETSP1356-20130122/4156_1 /TAXON_ID=77927 ORGANISM="Hemiselmis virescens, Strain PCC157" /NCGR_SAMPLE_ID=MMETSP1356 /ASSEMBLY_ACC=CAM_ASM_000847 /LENGTH=264 /DNA_ID=CAMNT_0014335723 /DNA_START=185 /DNA_END=979 /DNA_ORIENTATION=-
MHGNDTAALEGLLAASPPDNRTLVWLETPSNPTWTIVGIAAFAAASHRTPNTVVCVDSTAATPVLTQPLSLGADIVMHSATKYLNGHSDIVAGALVCNQEGVGGEVWDRVKKDRGLAGAVIGTFDAWLLQRGMRTLFVRVRQQCQSALRIATELDKHPKVTVLYPGLPTHPEHLIAKSQMEGGFGGMMSLRIAGGKQASVDFAANLRVFKLATSLGGVESLCEHRGSIEGPTSPVPDDLLRLSVGIESAEDLVRDLLEAADKVP